MFKTESRKIAVVYIAVTNGGNLETYSERFVRSFLQNPPGEDHDLIVVCNGGPLMERVQAQFRKLECSFFVRENDPGWDISAYQDVASRTDAELLVCLGESVYFHKPGWLSRIASAWREHGQGFYGFFSSHHPNAHMNTTAFACDPLFLRRYPAVISHKERYGFEHGRHSLWRRVVAAHLPAMLVTWDGVWPPGKWRMPDNIMQRGDQSNCLAWCNHSDRWINVADVRTKANWSAMSDKAFR